jgi:hypothetical protein
MSLLHDLLVLLGLAHDEPPVPLQIRLFDPLAQPMPSAPFVVTVGGEDRPGVADETGLASAGDAPESGTVAVKWRRRPEDYPSDLDPLGPDDYEYRADGITLVLAADLPEATAERLRNLGYFGGVALNDVIKAFQADHGLLATGDSGDADFQAELVREHDGPEPVRVVRLDAPDPLPEEED